MRLIDADAAKNKIRKEMVNADLDKLSFAICLAIINMFDDAGQLPTIEAEPVRHGRWDESTVPFCNVCPECGAVVERNCVKCNGSLNRCPNCGAKMDGKENKDAEESSGK